MDAVRFLGTAPGRLERVVGVLPAAGSLGCRSTLPLGRVRPYFVRSVPPPGGAGRRGVRVARPPCAAMGSDLFALDFDGVLCDSCGESSLSAVKVSSSVLLLACLISMRQMSNGVRLIDLLCLCRPRRLGGRGCLRRLTPPWRSG
jgi:hypothetical protein